MPPMSLVTLARKPPAFPPPINPYRPPKPHAVVEKVDEDSIAAEIGIQPGDEILTVNGQPMEDVIDYRFLITEEEVEIVVAPGARAEDAYSVVVEKELDETLAHVRRQGHARCVLALRDVLDDPDVVRQESRGFVSGVVQADRRLLMVIDFDKVIGEERTHGG